MREAVALGLVPGIAGARYRALRAEHGSAAAALDAIAGGKRSAVLAEADELLDRCTRLGVAVLTPEDARYPALLDRLFDPPPFLFVRGNLGLLDAPCVAIVGTRRASAYAERVARQLAIAISGAGGTVVSGMALGVDAAAHRGALDTTGATVAVLGTGIDIAYPAAHRTLHEELGQRALLVSELLPGDRAHGGSFPMRNRIIAGLCRALIVVEAPAQSGALTTARHAEDLNLDVAAVPGRIDDARALGSNALLRDGAAVVASIQDALCLAGLEHSAARPADPARTPTERAVWEALANGPVDPDSLSSALALPAADVLAAVSALELAGAVTCELTGSVARRI